MRIIKTLLLTIFTTCLSIPQLHLHVTAITETDNKELFESISVSEDLHIKRFSDFLLAPYKDSVIRFLSGKFKDRGMNVLLQELLCNFYNFELSITPVRQSKNNFRIKIEVGAAKEVAKEFTIQPVTVGRLFAEDGWFPELKEDANPVKPWEAKIYKRPGLQNPEEHEGRGKPDISFSAPPGLTLPSVACCADKKEEPAYVQKPSKRIKNRPIEARLALGSASILDQKMIIPSEKTLAELCAEFDRKQVELYKIYAERIMSVLSLDPPKKRPKQLSLQEEMELASAESFLMRLNSLNLEPTRQSQRHHKLIRCEGLE